jgi:hypothetical protein
VADGLVVCGLSERVQAHGQGVGWKIGNQIDFGLINLPQQSPGIVFPAQLVSSEHAGAYRPGGESGSCAVGLAGRAAWKFRIFEKNSSYGRVRNQRRYTQSDASSNAWIAASSRSLAGRARSLPAETALETTLPAGRAGWSVPAAGCGWRNFRGRNRGEVEHGAGR